MSSYQNPAPDTVATKCRLVTRSDFDGLVCAVLLKHLNMIDNILFVHPKDMQDGKVEVSDRDRISELNAAHARLEAKVAELEESWLELEMAMEE